VAVVVIGGQTLCLLLTLVVTPVAYSLLDDVSQKLHWQRLVRRPVTVAEKESAVPAK
jgi:HAE1 family hydrophobic/amphiphilic exporter-1